jgi:Domain of unknown function (DUF4157)
MRDRINRKSMPADHNEHDTPSPAVAEASANPAFSGHDFANISVFPKDAVQESGISSEPESQKGTPDPSHQFGSYSRLQRPASAGHDFSSMNIFPNQAENRTGLPDQILQRMENAFGHDFSEVRTQETAEPEKFEAQAFARGNELHFRPGAFDPHSQTGLSMIGHELAHVVQQRQGRARGAGSVVLEDAGLESEAEELGARAADGAVVGEVVSRGTGSGVVDAPVQRSGKGKGKRRVEEKSEEESEDVKEKGAKKEKRKEGKEEEKEETEKTGTKKSEEGFLLPEKGYDLIFKDKKDKKIEINSNELALKLNFYALNYVKNLKTTSNSTLNNNLQSLNWNQSQFTTEVSDSRSYINLLRDLKSKSGFNEALLHKESENSEHHVRTRIYSTVLEKSNKGMIPDESDNRSVSWDKYEEMTTNKNNKSQKNHKFFDPTYLEVTKSLKALSQKKIDGSPIGEKGITEILYTLLKPNSNSSENDKKTERENKKVKNKQNYLKYFNDREKQEIRTILSAFMLSEPLRNAAMISYGPLVLKAIAKGEITIDQAFNEKDSEIMEKYNKPIFPAAYAGSKHTLNESEQLLEKRESSLDLDFSKISKSKKGEGKGHLDRMRQFERQSALIALSMGSSQKDNFNTREIKFPGVFTNKKDENINMIVEGKYFNKYFDLASKNEEKQEAKNDISVITRIQKVMEGLESNEKSQLQNKLEELIKQFQPKSSSISNSLSEKNKMELEPK